MLEAEHGSRGGHAAVAAVIRMVNGELQLLFIKRAEVAHDPWSGHVAFPGGRREPQDGSLLDTAVRETCEELSLDLARGEVIGRLDDISPRTRTLPAIVVRPYVAVTTPDVTLVPSREVAATFWVPISKLRDPSAQDEHHVIVNGVKSSFAAYRFEQHYVWGLTERIVRQLLSLWKP